MFRLLTRFMSVSLEFPPLQLHQLISAGDRLPPLPLFWRDGIEGFTTVDENTKFYLNEKGNPVVVFAPYEIAPGAFGAQEFEIIL